MLRLSFPPLSAEARRAYVAKLRDAVPCFFEAFEAIDEVKSSAPVKIASPCDAQASPEASCLAGEEAAVALSVVLDLKRRLTDASAAPRSRFFLSHCDIDVFATELEAWTQTRLEAARREAASEAKEKADAEKDGAVAKAREEEQKRLDADRRAFVEQEEESEKRLRKAMEEKEEVAAKASAAQEGAVAKAREEEQRRFAADRTALEAKRAEAEKALRKAREEKEEFAAKAREEEQQKFDAERRALVAKRLESEEATRKARDEKEEFVAKANAEKEGAVAKAREEERRRFDADRKALTAKQEEEAEKAEKAEKALRRAREEKEGAAAKAREEELQKFDVERCALVAKRLESEEAARKATEGKEEFAAKASAVAKARAEEQTKFDAERTALAAKQEESEKALRKAMEEKEAFVAKADAEKEEAVAKAVAEVKQLVESTVDATKKKKDPDEDFSEMLEGRLGHALPPKDAGERSVTDGRIWEEQCVHVLRSIESLFRANEDGFVGRLQGNGRLRLRSKLVDLPPPSPGLAGQFDKAYLEICVEDEKSLLVVAGQLRVESKGGKNDRTAYAQKVVEDLRALRAKSPDLYTHLAFIQWNGEVSGADVRKMAAQEAQVFSKASEAFNYLAMIHEIYGHFSTKLVERSRSRDLHEALLASELQVNFNQRLLKHTCDAAVANAKLVAEHPETSMEQTELRKFWVNLLQAIKPAQLLPAVASLVAKAGQKNSLWTVEDCQQLRDCFAKKIDAFETKAKQGGQRATATTSSKPPLKKAKF